MTSSSQKFQDHGALHPPRGKLHVTVLASEWRSTKGDLSTISRELAIELAKFPEVKITYFLPQCSDEDKRTALSHHIEIVEATRLSGYDELEWLSFPPDDLQIDVIVGHGVKLGHQAQVIRKSHKCKWIQVVYTDPEELGMYKFYKNPISTGEKKHEVEVELCEKADFVVGVGRKLCEAFRRYLRWCKKDEIILALTPGVFDEFANVKHASEEREQCGILVFGRGDAEHFQLKGFDVAGKAVAELSDTHLVFVGAPEGKHEDITKRLLDCGVPAHRLAVRSFLQSREDLKRLFCQVDLVLMPSRTEGFGLTGLVALSAGLPVLVSQNSGFGEALCEVPLGSACVIDSEDPLVWAEAIKKVWKKDRETRLQEAELLRSSYKKKYSWAKQSEDLVKKMVNIVNQDCQSSSQGEEGLSASSTTKAPQTMTGEQTGSRTLKKERRRRKDEQEENLQGQLREFGQQLGEKDRQGENLQRQVREMEQQLRENGEREKNLERQLTEAEQQLREKDERENNLQRQLTEAEQQLREKDEREKYLQSQLREMKQLWIKLQGQCKEIKQESSNLERQLRDRDQDLAEVNKTLSETERKLKECKCQEKRDWIIPREDILITNQSLGSGGWGYVHEGKYCGCTVAVKRLYEHISPYNRGKFEREMDIASRCRHPCLLQFIGATNDESPLFVTELMELSLRQLLKKGALSDREVVTISLDVARALSYLHKKKPSPILHRDVSSPNVLLWRRDEQWRAKVSDYGTANFLQETMTANPGAMIYSAPEACSPTQTVKIDVYSFGVLLCEMCIQKMPDLDRRDTQVSLVENPVIQALIRRCLQSVAKDRPNMEEIIEELEQLSGTS